MKHLCAILFVCLVGYSCKNKPATNLNQPATDSSRYYPLADFIKEQIQEVELRNFEIHLKHTLEGKTDSSLISKETFKMLATPFLQLDISREGMKQGYAETVFHDLSTASYTLNYRAKQTDTGVRNMDILLDEQTKTVKRVFIVSELQKADTVIMEHHGWTANKQFQITRTIQTTNNRTNEITTVDWNRKQF